MVDKLVGATLGLSDVRDLLPLRGGKRVSVGTVKHWIVSGAPTIAGGRVRLKASRVGSRWCIAREDLEAFLVSQNAPAVASATG